MKWKRSGKRSGDLIDRRGGGGSLSGPAKMGAGIGLPAILVLVVSLFLNGGGDGGSGGSPGIDDILGQLGGAPQGGGEPIPPEQDPDARLVDFMSFLIDDIQAFWDDTFTQAGKEYPRSELVLFTGSTSSACGGATSAIGPHYCPPDQKMYIDLDFFRDLKNRFGAPGDFAQAYVLAHEIGHHVQNVLGINRDISRQQQSDPDQANELSVRLELQADCLAGVWAFTTYQRDLLESGDLNEGLEAAAAVGDDRIQEQSGGRVNPESWTHGSSEQRVKWFRAGFENGDPDSCDTFSVDEV
jgi:predicted metalloprotease